MKNYIVNFGTGRGNEEFDTIEEAKEYVEQNLCYTQVSIDIVDRQKGEIVAVMLWWNVEPSKDDVVTAKFGDKGFYGGWVDFE